MFAVSERVQTEIDFYLIIFWILHEIAVFEFFKKETDSIYLILENKFVLCTNHSKHSQ